MSLGDTTGRMRRPLPVLLSLALAGLLFLVGSGAASESLSRIPRASRAARHSVARKVARAPSKGSRDLSYHAPRPPAIYHPVRVSYLGSSGRRSSVARAATARIGRFRGSTGARPGAPVDAKVASLESPIEHFSRLSAIDPDLTRAVIAAESGGDHLSVSPKGAKGLMQLMPQTASMLGVRNAFDPVENIHGGTRYLRSLYDRFGRVDLALWAYNAGPGAVEKGRMPDETRAYISKVYDYFRRFRSQ